VHYQNNYPGSNLGVTEPNFTMIQPQNNYNNPFNRNLSNNNMFPNINRQYRQNMTSNINNPNSNSITGQEQRDHRVHLNNTNIFSPFNNQSNAQHLNDNQLNQNNHRINGLNTSNSLSNYSNCQKCNGLGKYPRPIMVKNSHKMTGTPFKISNLD